MSVSIYLYLWNITHYQSSRLCIRLSSLTESDTIYIGTVGIYIYTFYTYMKAMCATYIRIKLCTGTYIYK